MMINQDKARELIAQYKRKLQIGAGLAGQDELYKWDIITKYHGKLDPSREDAVTQISKLNIANLVYPYAGNALKRFSKEVPNEYRPILEHLFAEDIPVNDRIKRYYEETKVLYATIQKNDKDKAYQDERTAAALLTIYNPEKYAFFMASHYETAVRALGVEPMPTHNRYEHYLSVLQELIPLLYEDTELISMIRKDTEGLVWSDMLLADDMLYQTIVYPCQAYVTYQDEQGWWTYENQMSVDDWKQVLSKIYTDHRNWINYLLSYMEMPDYTASCVQMGEHMGVDAQSVNSTITHIGQEVNKQITRFRVVRERNYEPTYYPIVMLGRDNAETKNFDWKLRPELVQALQELGYEKQGLFTWIPFYAELAEKLLSYKDNRQELVEFIYAEDGLAKYTNYLHKQDKSVKIDDIDPLSFFGIFNTSNKRNSKLDNRIDILKRIKVKFGITADVPSDFDGIPLLNYIRSFYFHWDRIKESCDFLWAEYAKLLRGDSIENYFQEYGFATRKAELTMPLFWIRPYEYLALDSKNCTYLENKGVVNDIRSSILSYEDYRNLLELTLQKMEAGEIPAKSFPELSYAAWQDGNQSDNEEENDSSKECKYFLAGYNFGYTNNQFDAFLGEGVWRGRGTKKVNDLIETVHPGDVLMLKSAYTRGSKHDISVLKVSAVGVVRTAPVLLDDGFYEFSVDYVRTDEKEFTDFKGSYLQTFHLTLDNLFIDYANSYLNNMANTTVSKYQEYIDLLEANKNLILTGAPGTGKTYMAKQIAKEMMGIASDRGLTIVQFHPSYDYTDFVEGLRPVQQDDQIVFRREDGIFKSFCKDALTNLADAKKSQSELNAEEAARKVLSSFIADAIADETVFKTQSDKDFSIVSENNLSIQIYIPQNEKAHHISVSKKELLQLLVAKPKIANSGDVWDFFGKKYRTQQDTYMATLYQEMRDKVEHVTVQSVKEKKFVFIIDEINRGDLSKILGDLFYAIDPGYRGKDNCCVKTQYQNLVDPDDDFGAGFYVPENVYILATMNDIDRSVESMDFAIRRRFAWKEVYAADTLDMLDSLTYADEAKLRLNALNEVIGKDETLGTAYQIGASFMLKLPLYKGDFNKLWQMHIEGTLKEYTRGMRNQAEKMESFKNAYDLK